MTLTNTLLQQQITNLQYEVGSAKSLFQKFRVYTNQQLGTIYEQLGELQNKKRLVKSDNSILAMQVAEINKTIETFETFLDDFKVKCQRSRENNVEVKEDISSLQREVIQIKQVLSRLVKT